MTSHIFTVGSAPTVAGSGSCGSVYPLGIPKYTFQDAFFRDTGDTGVRYLFHAHSTTAVSATFQLGNLGLFPAEVF